MSQDVHGKSAQHRVVLRVENAGESVAARLSRCGRVGGDTKQRVQRVQRFRAEVVPCWFAFCSASHGYTMRIDLKKLNWGSALNLVRKFLMASSADKRPHACTHRILERATLASTAGQNAPTTVTPLPSASPPSGRRGERARSRP